MNRNTDMCNCAACGKPTSVGLPTHDNRYICFECAECIRTIMDALHDFEKYHRSVVQRRAAAERKKAC